MKNIKSVLATSVFAFIFWMFFVLQDINILNINFQEIITGIIISFIIGYFVSPLFIKEDGFWLLKEGRIFKLIAYIPFYLIELIKANLDVAKRALAKKVDINPGIVKIKTDLKSDYGLAMLANSITLTPGTITMDIYEEDEENYMYIHCIDVPSEDIDKAGEAIKGAFEKRIKGVFK